MSHLHALRALCGVGLGAFWIDETNLIFFNSLATPPDKGISQALELLGFRFTEKWSQEEASPPFEALRSDLVHSPAILGPLDVGFLYYDPLHSNFSGVDHFVLAYGMGDSEIYLHDPAGFPHVALSLDHLELAWRAEHIDYHRGFYRYWTALQRFEQPTEEDIFNHALQSFKVGYQISERIVTHEPWAKNWAIGREAILKCVNQARHGHVTPELMAHLTHFMLKLSARRALDFAAFFNLYAPALAVLKCKQAELFGKSHTLAVQESWSSFAETLQELANLEEEFRTVLLNHETG